jgi:hypothetical protein
MFNGGLVCCSMRLGVPFIAPRQLGAVGSPFGRQFLPSIGWRTGQSGAPPDMNSARFVSFLGEADCWALGPLGTLDSPVRPSDVGSGHVSPIDHAVDRWCGRCWLTGQFGAYRTVQWILATALSVISREQRVRCWASLGTEQSGASQAGASLAGLSQTSPIQSHLIWQGS